MSLSATATDKPYIGFGLGLRTEHYEDVLTTLPAVDWLEVISENYMVDGGKALSYLDRIRAHYPMVMHGVSLSIGSTQSLDFDYLKRLRALVDRVQPAWFSDHLCWTGVNDLNLHDLMPLPYTEEAITHVVERIQQVQDYMGQQMLIENVSSYVSYHESQIPEWEFIREIAQRADCLLLLDINNVYVSAFNHNHDPRTYLDAMPEERVWQIHLAGHTHEGDLIIDTHDHPIADPVYDLYAAAIRKYGRVSTMIERDDNIPPLPELLSELNKVKKIAHQQFREQAA